MAAKEKNFSLRAAWFLPLLLLLAAVFVPSAAANIPRLSETRVGAIGDFAPASIQADRDFDQEPQGFYRPLCYDNALNPPIDPDGRFGRGVFQGSQVNNSSPANSSWAFDAGYWLGGLSASLGEGFLRGAQGELNAVTFGAMRGTLDQSWEAFGMANNQGDSAFAFGQGSGQVAMGALTLASGAAVLEVPSIYVGATTVAYSPWTPVAIGGAAAGAYTYSQGGSAGDVALSTVTGSAMMYMAAPFPMGGQNAPPRTVNAPNGNSYSVAFQTQLNSADLGRSRPVHFNRANAALDSALRADPQFAAQMDQLIPGVQASVSSVGGRATPSGWVWHHAESPGAMQLVPQAQHTPGSIFWNTLHAGGQGGYSLWAIPAGAPANR
jgi:hypothetical protein